MVTEDGQCARESSRGLSNKFVNLGERRPLVWIIQINVFLSSLESLLICIIHGLRKGGSHKSLKVKTFDQCPLVCVLG